VVRASRPQDAHPDTLDATAIGVCRADPGSL